MSVTKCTLLVEAPDNVAYSWTEFPNQSILAFTLPRLVDAWDGFSDPDKEEIIVAVQTRVGRRLVIGTVADRFYYYIPERLCEIINIANYRNVNKLVNEICNHSNSPTALLAQGRGKNGLGNDPLYHTDVFRNSMLNADPDVSESDDPVVDVVDNAPEEQAHIEPYAIVGCAHNDVAVEIIDNLIDNEGLSDIEDDYLPATENTIEESNALRAAVEELSLIPDFILVTITVTIRFYNRYAGHDVDVHADKKIRIVNTPFIHLDVTLTQLDELRIKWKNFEDKPGKKVINLDDRWWISSV